MASMRESSRARYWSVLYWFLSSNCCMPIATSSSDTTWKQGAGLEFHSWHAAARQSSGICWHKWDWPYDHCGWLHRKVLKSVDSRTLTCRLMVMVGKCLWTLSTIFSIRRITDSFSDGFVRTIAGQRFINISQSCLVTRGFCFGPSSTYSEPWNG